MSYPKYEKYQIKGKSKKLTLYQRLSLFYHNSKRILKIANKPDKKEYFMVFKICGIGILLLGVISYVIQLIFSVLSKALF
ncbi:MAG: protein translocase SEC61 complex subunit gamma [Promethearchaeota archaeon]